MLMTLRSIGWHAEAVDDGQAAVELFTEEKVRQQQQLMAATQTAAAAASASESSSSAASTAATAAIAARTSPLASLSSPFVCVLMDNHMPLLSGVEATRAIRALGFSMPIVGVTGNAMEEDKDEFIQAGAQHVLTKPVNVAKMKAMLAAYGAAAAAAAAAGATAASTPA